MGNKTDLEGLLNTYEGNPTLKARADAATKTIISYPEADGIFAVMPDGCDDNGEPTLALVLWLESAAQRLIVGRGNAGVVDPRVEATV